VRRRRCTTAASAGTAGTSCTLADEDALSDDYIGANIGGKVLEPFRRVSDRPAGKVGFVARRSDR